MSTFQGDDIDRLLEEANTAPVKQENGGRRRSDRDSRGDRSRDRDSRRRRRSRSRDSRRRRRRSRSRSHRRERRRRDRDMAEREAELEQRYHKAAERHRRTVFAANIHPKVDEYEIFEFFSEVGKVIDIQLLRDSRSFRSKGLSYIEFEQVESITTALSLNGKMLGGFPIVVQLTQGEKNIAAQIAQDAVSQQTSLVLKIAGLPLKVHDDDLRPVFEAFGEIQDLYLRRSKDEQTREGHVEYTKTGEGLAALQQLNGLEILGAKMQLEPEGSTIEQLTAMAADPLAEAAAILGGPAHEAKVVSLESEGGNGAMSMTAASRAQLMAKLHGGAFAQTVTEAQQPYNPAPAAPPQAPAPPAMVPTTCLLLRNMFNPANETDPDFDLDIREDVMEEVQKYGALQHIYVDKTSQDGQVFLRFRDVPGGQNTFNALHSRWFGQNQISAEFIPEEVYVNQFPDS